MHVTHVIASCFNKASFHPISLSLLKVQGWVELVFRVEDKLNHSAFMTDGLIFYTVYSYDFIVNK